MEHLDIHIRQLRYFMELAKCLNFTKAALNLYIAQPALSQQIAELEKQLGTALFVRNSRSVALTPAGEILFDACPDILARLEGVHEQMLQAQAGVRGSLRIGYLDTFKHLLPPILNAFRQQYPDVSVELYSGTLREQKNALLGGHIDVAFATIDYYDMGKEEAPAFNVLWQDDMCLVIHEDHPFVTSGGRDYSLLEYENLLLLDDNTSPAYPLIAQDICAQIGLKAKKRKSVNTVASIMIQVDAGFGYTLLPYSVIHMAHKHVVFIPVKKSCMDFGVVWLHTSANAALPLFLDVIAQTADTVPNE